MGWHWLPCPTLELGTWSRWLGSVTVRTLDLRSRARGFDSWSARSQVVTTRMGDCLRTGKPSQYITNHQRQLSLPSLRGRQIEYRPAWLGLRRGTFTCLGWQVTLCDPIWQVMLRSSVMGFQSIKSYAHLYIYLLPLPLVIVPVVVVPVVVVVVVVVVSAGVVCARLNGSQVATHHPSYVPGSCPPYRTPRVSVG